MRRFIKPVLVTIGAATAAFLIANPGSPINASPAAKAKTITICEEEPPETNIVDLPTVTLPTISLPQLAELIPCIPVPELPTLQDLEDLIVGSIPPITLPVIQLPQLIPPIPPIPAIGFEGFPGFPDCSYDSVGQTVFEFCPENGED